VWSGSGLKSTWMENAQFVEVERHPLYTRVREIFLKQERELAVTVWDSNQREGSVLFGVDTLDGSLSAIAMVAAMPAAWPIIICTGIPIESLLSPTAQLRVVGQFVSRPNPN
jgi:hypothetical protein